MTRESVVPNEVPGGRRTPKIVASGLGCTYSVGTPSAVQALAPLDLTIYDGEFVCLVGPSGCGKSTFLRLAAGLLRPTEGELTLELSGHTPSPISMVFQDHSVFPWMTVRDNVAFGLRSRGVRKREAVDMGMEWVVKLGLQDFAGAYPATLSGGMRQRVSIARALAVGPEVLLMDEPFAALDAQLREVLQEELLALWQNDRRTVIFVTHSLDEAVLLGDRIIAMTARPGRILAERTVPFPRPRLASVRDQPEFAKLRAELWGFLRGEIEPHSTNADGDGAGDEQP
ncbi:MAG: ABC transporter ATP-binding protein [Acidimicrobiia bacterium]